MSFEVDVFCEQKKDGRWHWTIIGPIPGPGTALAECCAMAKPCDGFPEKVASGRAGREHATHTGWT